MSSFYLKLRACPGLVPCRRPWQTRVGYQGPTLAVIVTAALILLACPGPFTLPEAVSADALRRVAMITWRGETPAETGFIQGIRRFGFPLSIIQYPADQDVEALDRIITTIGADRPDLVYVFGTTATKKVLAAIRDLPVVFNVVTRPVESGIIAGWASSGNNATGVSSMVPILNQLRTLGKVIRFTRLGIIYNPLEQNATIQRDIVKELEGSLNFTLHEFTLTGARDLPRVLGELDGSVDAVFLPSDSMVKMLGGPIMAGVNRCGIPSLSAMEEMVTQDSALLGLVPDYHQMGRLAAVKADRVLNGTPPCEIPTATLDHFSILVNMRTARQIGIDIPTSILVMADRIIR
jgi:putative ABC transport system substrate-binding protein